MWGTGVGGWGSLEKGSEEEGSFRFLGRKEAEWEGKKFHSTSDAPTTSQKDPEGRWGCFLWECETLIHGLDGKGPLEL